MSFLHDALDILRAAVTLFAIPPVAFLWLALAGAATRIRRPRLGGILGGIGLAGLYALAMPVVSRALMEGLQTPATASTDGAAPQAIVVLGGDGLQVLETRSGAEPGPLSFQRLAGAALLARKTGLPVLMTGGVVGSGQPPIAELMAAAFEDAFGLPDAWVENQSENTCENARFSARLLREKGVGKALIVTHSWHMPRALLSFERAGYPVAAAPLNAEIDDVHGVSDFLPHAGAWMRSYYAIHEWIGLVAYRLGACPRSTP